MNSSSCGMGSDQESASQEEHVMRRSTERDLLDEPGADGFAVLGRRLIAPFAHRGDGPFSQTVRRGRREFDALRRAFFIDGKHSGDLAIEFGKPSLIRVRGGLLMDNLRQSPAMAGGGSGFVAVEFAGVRPTYG